MKGDYLGPEGTLRKVTATWPRHIGSFERQYDKAFAVNILIGADMVDHIHKHVYVFLQSRNTTYLDDVDREALSKFGELQRRVEWGEWIISTPTWVELPAPKGDMWRNLESDRGTVQTQSKIEEDNNRYMDPRLRVMYQLHEFFKLACQEGHMCLKGSYDK